MEIALQGAALGCKAQSLWDSRMLTGGKTRRICSYYPDIGRGSIEHQTVSHEDADRGLARCAKKSLLEKVSAWLDI